MQLTARQQLTQFAHVLQRSLFPVIEEELGALSPQAKLLTSALAMIRLEQALPRKARMGRPNQDRRRMAAAFLAKAIYGCTTTRQAIAMLRTNSQMRRLCGWKHVSHLPHESTFSRSFAEFSKSQLPQELHRLLICETHKNRLVGHISRDSTAIEVRERFPDTKPARKKKTKRPKRAKANERGTCIERQRHMTLQQMLAKLPTDCSLGVKTSRSGNQQYWRGYKLHLDAADGQIPISAVLTAARVHDSQVAIALMHMSAQRVTWLYDVMDSAYDADAILKQSKSMNHVPIVQPHPRRQGRSKSILPKIFPAKQVPQMTWAQQDRFKERTTVERVNARLKDEFGGRHIRVRGAMKVFAHLAFGLLALTVDQLLRLSG
jgi:transposase